MATQQEAAASANSQDITARQAAAEKDIMARQAAAESADHTRRVIHADKTAIKRLSDQRPSKKNASSE
jgi:hypothetical protein